MEDNTSSTSQQQILPLQSEQGISEEIVDNNDQPSSSSTPNNDVGHPPFEIDQTNKDGMTSHHQVPLILSPVDELQQHQIDTAAETIISNNTTTPTMSHQVDLVRAAEGDSVAVATPVEKESTPILDSNTDLLQISNEYTANNVNEFHVKDNNAQLQQQQPQAQSENLVPSVESSTINQVTNVTTFDLLDLTGTSDNVDSNNSANGLSHPYDQTITKSENDQLGSFQSNISQPESAQLEKSNDKENDNSNTSTQTTNDHQQYRFIDSTDRKISFLEVELAKAQSIIEHQQEQLSKGEAVGGDGSLLVEIQMDLQSKLQSEIQNRQQAESTVQQLQTRLSDLENLNKKQTTEIEEMKQQQGKMAQILKENTDSKKQIEKLKEQVNDLQRITTRQRYEIVEYDKQVKKIQSELEEQQQERSSMQKELAEHERQQMSATSRLTQSRKHQQELTTLAGKYEDLMISALAERDQYKQDVNKLRTAKDKLENDYKVLEEVSTKQITKTLAKLDEERELNKNRKVKMKSFIENKMEEIRIAKEDNETIQIELARTNKIIVDLNNRYATLHEQWKQSQTRNRELQRDLNKLKKDSENLHKVGDTLEMKLSKSAVETEEHKHKRLAAKNELMTVLKTLDIERSISVQYKNSFKYKLLPSLLNHYESVQNCISILQRQLLQLSMRLGKALPSSSTFDDYNSTSNSANDSNSNLSPQTRGGNGSTPLNLSESDAAINKVESELQKVSDSIQKLVSNIEILQKLVDDSGERTCYTVLSELVTSSSLIQRIPSSIVPGVITTNGSGGGGTSGINNATPNSPDAPRRITLPTLPQSHRYGQLSNAETYES